MYISYSCIYIYLYIYIGITYIYIYIYIYIIIVYRPMLFFLEIVILEVLDVYYEHPHLCIAPWG